MISFLIRQPWTSIQIIRNINISPQKHKSVASESWTDWQKVLQHAALHYSTTNIWGGGWGGLHCKLSLSQKKWSFPVSITQGQGHATTALEGNKHTQSSNRKPAIDFPSFIVTSSRQIRSERNKLTSCVVTKSLEKLKYSPLKEKKALTTY